MNNLITIKFTNKELLQLESEFLALSQQGCLSKEFCEEIDYEYDSEYVKNFYSIYSKIQKAIKDYNEAEFYRLLKKQKRGAR